MDQRRHTTKTLPNGKKAAVARLGMESQQRPKGPSHLEGQTSLFRPLDNNVTNSKCRVVVETGGHTLDARPLHRPVRSAPGQRGDLRPTQRFRRRRCASVGDVGHSRRRMKHPGVGFKPAWDDGQNILSKCRKPLDQPSGGLSVLGWLKRKICHHAYTRTRLPPSFDRDFQISRIGTSAKPKSSRMRFKMYCS